MEKISKTDKSCRVLAAARKAWSAAGDFRSRRQRAKRFTYGDQWSDLKQTRFGETVTEGEDAIKNGRTPMTNNLIRRLVKCVVGHFRLNTEQERRETPLKLVYDLNSLDELDSRMLEEFLISGCAVQRVSCERRPQGEGTWVDNVSPDRFFINAIADPRGWDAELIGQLHDMSFGEVVMRFGKGDPARVAALNNIYGDSAADSGFADIGNPSRSSFTHAAPGRCRVVEVWTLEAIEQLKCHDPLYGKFTISAPAQRAAIEAENEQRILDGAPPIEMRTDYATGWHCRWLAPDGSLLASYPSPLPDSGHPYIFKLYPLIDGEVHSLVEDVIDQQIYVNRLITTINHIMSCSAKGALLVPEGCEPPGPKGLMQLAHMWASPDAVIPYRPRSDGQEPHQVGGKAADIGARELLALEIQMFEDVSGISDALMGKPGNGNVGFERYESQVRNAMVAIADLLGTFNHLRKSRDKLISGIGK